MKNLLILGSTGSIGRNTLDVVRKNSDKFNIYALIAKSNVDLMLKQCLYFQPSYVCMTDKNAMYKLKNHLNIYNMNIRVLSGLKAICKLASLAEVDIVMSAISGIDGLMPTLSAIRAGKKVLLANKESLVVCGKIFIDELQKYNACLLPVDSEHNAIFQVLPESFQHRLGYTSLNEHNISNIVLTGSGGPFLHTPLSNLSHVTPEQACVHPNWSMGKKISVDSATMMNKGLEYIEARWLFNASAKQIDILLHPQSIIHSMVNYVDGSVLAQLAIPDMKVSIAYAMSYPDRIKSNVTKLDFLRLGMLNFYPLDKKRYPCLQLAIDAGNTSQSATIILNAANDIAVDAFLRNKILFTEIVDVIRRVLDKFVINQEPKTVEEVLFIDQQARASAVSSVNYFSY